MCCESEDEWVKDLVREIIDTLCTLETDIVITTNEHEDTKVRHRFSAAESIG